MVNSDIVSLTPLIEFASKDQTLGALGRITERERSAYGQITAHLVEGVADSKGFYLWGFYESQGLWRNKYLGKAGYGRISHLRARIREELNDERVVFWASRRQEAFEIGQKVFPEKWSEYRLHWERALRKAPSTHIVWVACAWLTDDAVTSVEADLIETLNPTANMQRPGPPSAFQGPTREIIGELRNQIHEHRPR
jgi:hypothetical protein